MFGQSSKIKIVKGRHMYDETVVETQTSRGPLKTWESGENGGGSECHHAYFHVGKDGRLESVTRLVALAETYGLRRGDCIKTSRVPDPVFEDGEIVGYMWKYYPSTN